MHEAILANIAALTRLCTQAPRGVSRQHSNAGAQHACPQVAEIQGRLSEARTALAPWKEKLQALHGARDVSATELQLLTDQATADQRRLEEARPLNLVHACSSACVRGSGLDSCGATASLLQHGWT